MVSAAHALDANAATVLCAISLCAHSALLLFPCLFPGCARINLVNVVMFFTFFLGSSIQPLWISFVTSKRFKLLMARARAEGGSGGASAGDKGRGGKIVALIAHHRPLYRLAHIISDPICYPYLLSFLQKEYSSENALFYLEARNFARAARQAENQISGWSSQIDGEDDGGGGGGVSVMETQFHAANQSQIHVRSPAVTAAAAASASQIRVGSSMSPGMQPLSSAAAANHQQPPSAMQAFSLPEPAIPMPPSTNASAAAAARHTDSPQGSPVPRDSPQGSPISGGAPFVGRRSSASGLGSSAQPQPATTSPAGSVMMTPPRSKMFVRVESNAGAITESPVATGARSVVSVNGSSALVKSSSTLSLHFPSKSAAAAPPALTFREMHESAARSRAWALQLYSDYLKPAALYEINIDSDLAKMVGAMVRQLEGWNPSPDAEEIDTAPPVPPPFPLSSLYKQTALSVFNLMETDSFRRFLLTADFQALLQRADDQEMARLERQPGVGASLASNLAKADEVLKLAVVEDGAVSMLPGTPQQNPVASPGFSRVKSMLPQSKLTAHAPRASISEEDADPESIN